MSTVYLVIDDREGLNTILATYDNSAAAEAHQAALVATGGEYSEYFLISILYVKSTFEGLD